METIAPRFEWSMAFLNVASCGSFTAAAEAMACSKGFLSKQISQLEKALGVQLLFRTTRRLTLTEAGRTYLEYCRQLRATFDEAEQAVSGLRREIAGLVRVTAPTTFGSMFMCDLLIEFRERYPKVEIELDLSREQRDLIGDGYDIAIRSSRNLDDRLVAKPLGVTQEWLVGSPRLIERHGRPSAPQDLENKPCVTNSHFKDDARWLFMHGEEKCMVTVRSGLSVNSYPTIRQLALAGAGFAKLPHYLVEADVKAGTLERVLSDYAVPNFPLYLVFPQRHSQVPKTRVLIDFIHDWFSRR